MNFFQRFFTPVQPVPAGFYHYQSPPSDPRNYSPAPARGRGRQRHADRERIDCVAPQSNRHRLCLLFRSQPARRPGGSEYVTAVRRQSCQAAKDYSDLADRVLTLIEMPDLDPVTFLDFERKSPHTKKPTAPFDWIAPSPINYLKALMPRQLRPSGWSVS